MSAPATHVARQTLPSSAKVWVLAVLSFLFFEFSWSSTVNGETTSETNIVIPLGLIFAVWCFFTIRGVAGARDRAAAAACIPVRRRAFCCRRGLARALQLEGNGLLDAPPQHHSTRPATRCIDVRARCRTCRRLGRACRSDCRRAVERYGKHRQWPVPR